MSQVSSSHPQESEKPPVPTLQPDRLARPGWREVVVGLVVLAAVAVGVAGWAGRLELGPVANGLVFTALAGVAPLAGAA